MNIHFHIDRALKFLGDFYYLIGHPQLKNAFRCKTHLTREEIVLLYRLAKGKQKILEIGSYIGASACCFGAASQELDVVDSGKIFCVDTWNNDAMTEGHRNTWAEFLRNVGPYLDKIVPVQGWSVDVVDKVMIHTDKLDLLFIDGDHSYEGVKADWDAYRKLLHDGSIVVFHDIGWAEGVKRVVEEDVEPIAKSSGRLPNMWWGILAQRP